MLRTKHVLVAGVGAVVLTIGLLVILVPSGSAASVTRFTTGEMNVESPSQLFVYVFNPTQKPVTGVVVELKFQGGFTLPVSDTLGTINPGAEGIDVFNCPGAAVGGNCGGTLVVSSPSKAVIPSALYVPNGGVETHLAFAGEWRIFK